MHYIYIDICNSTSKILQLITEKYSKIKINYNLMSESEKDNIINKYKKNIKS